MKDRKQTGARSAAATIVALLAGFAIPATATAEMPQPAAKPAESDRITQARSPYITERTALARTLQAHEAPLALWLTTDPAPTVRAVAAESLAAQGELGHALLTAIAMEHDTVDVEPIAAHWSGTACPSPKTIFHLIATRHTQRDLGALGSALRRCAERTNPAIAEMVTRGQLSAAKALLVADDPDALAKALANVLKDDDSPHLAALNLARTLGNPGLAPPLSRLGLHGSTPGLRAKAIEALAACTSENETVAMSALSDPDPLVRAAGIRLCAKHQIDACTDILVTLLGEGETDLTTIAEAITRMGSDAHIRTLWHRYPTLPPAARLTTIRAAIDASTPNAAVLFAHASRDPLPWIRAEAFALQDVESAQVVEQVVTTK